MAEVQADFNTTKKILDSAGIPIVGLAACSREEALRVADEIGYPVVMKLISPDIIHKTDVGVVLLDIADRQEAECAYDCIIENATRAGSKQIDGVLVQKQAKRGFELLVGARQDAVFGPVTMVGYGGRFVELFRDVAPGVGVLTHSDVERMLEQTMAGRVIEGFRGPALDKRAIIDLAINVSKLMASHPEIRELDLNPVIVYPEGFSIVDARMILGDPIIHPRAEDLSEARLTSLKSIFDAKSVAVVGASRPGTIGGIILKNSSRLDKLYPINPRRETLMGLPCYPNISAIPEPVDVAVFAVPPHDTIRGFQEFCERGGKGAVIVSDGYAEIGRPDLEEQLKAISEKHGVVYIGPNGLGLFDSFTGFNTLFLPLVRSQLPSRSGPIGIISQSGGIGLELLEMAAEDNLPIGTWVSVGNASGISIPELLEHMGRDDRIKIIAVYMEGLRNGLQFMEVGRRVAQKKPVIVIKGGMAGGAQATMSHTASLAGSFEAFKAACRQAGFFLLEELTEDPKILINILSILTTQKAAKNNRVGVVSVGGGAAILLADQITSHGMRLTEFEQDTKRRLSELLIGKIHVANEEEKERIAARVAANPLDLFGDANDDRLLEAIRILNDDPNTDVIVAGLYLQVPYLSEYIGERLADLQRELSKPLIISPRGLSPYVMRMRSYMTQHDVHTYTVPTIKPLSIAIDIWRRYGTDFTV
ncbi:MAG TPA: acetate--CoA ligase family protein [Polyangiaceae bacterium]|jgi:3-hydroxypropionyl-CoA synthetase (ADP-forming)|nr:MAG: succinyl-CoA synthetase subunit alpha [Deltaproteobacteria bacterium ADurb.Bin207]HNS98159.1 acetate--CoA ligase family protein [Polyangiaceae bacterium]HNZ22293.1 acetate--CoA ligase family protein [Polyangiaceae bacterium]HOD24999.1 acetate--CoA ligase family protein [Polyangiaceae bacterium]HOE51222.1 acetate--CoA ligase family protein [Polyangiaceae bacterium]